MKSTQLWFVIMLSMGAGGMQLTNLGGRMDFTPLGTFTILLRGPGVIHDGKQGAAILTIEVVMFEAFDGLLKGGGFP